MCKTEVRQLRNYHEYIKTLDNYHYHIKTKDGVFCPKCSSRLFVLKKNVLPKISLYLKCSCGEIYRCKYIKIEAKKRI